MAYIGKTPITGNFVKLDAISVVNGQAGYTMNNGGSAFTDYETVNQFLVSLNGILQAPTTSFTVSGSTLTFASNLATGDVIDFVIVLGNTLDIGTPSDSTITQAKTNFVSTSSSAGLQIKGDSTTAGTLQLNCEQNSHGVKLRSPAHSSGQSYTLTLPTGNVTADKFLKVASVSGSGTTGIGQLSFADAGGGDMVKISSNTLSGASSYSTDALDSTYFAYRLIVQITDVSNQYALISGRLRTSSSDITSANYTWTVDGAFRYTNNSSGNGTLTGGYAGDTEWHLHGEGGLDTDDGEGVNMIIDLINPSGSSGFKNGFCKSSFLYDSARWYYVDSSFKYASQSPYTGFSLYTSAGTMTGTVNLYGIK
tara:strand:+ start:841 stop:1938 length:1098 start_codon:yes stop_codon:yes gene_type:complete